MSGTPSIRIWCLHGNWQTPDVWQPVTDAIREGLSRDGGIAIEVHTVDYWRTSAADMKEWAGGFNREVRATRDSAREVLIGYSMGGRLALHALIDEPGLWDLAIVVAADPGSSDPGINKAALDRDEYWAARLSTEPVDKVITDWDKLPVFGGRENLSPRNLSNLNASDIADVMVRFSKGHQRDLSASLTTLKTPVAYVSGSEDEKYGAIGRALEDMSVNITHIVIPQAGHRVPWENRTGFVAAVVRSIREHLTPE